jgi:hypothetical protein
MDKMDKQSLVKIFNDKLYEFVSDLLLIYPEDIDLYTFKSSLNVIWLIDDKKTIKIFNRYVVEKYRTELSSRNEQFFIDYSFDNEIQQYTKNETDFSIQLMNKLKSYWSDMKNENKTIVFKYFDVLIAICDKYIIA